MDQLFHTNYFIWNFIQYLIYHSMETVFFFSNSMEKKNSMEFHERQRTLHVIPWNSMSQTQIEFHGIPWKIFHGKFSMELHGIPWNSMGLFNTGQVCFPLKRNERLATWSADGSHSKLHKFH